MGVPLSVVDAFADAPLTGNPAAVVQLDRWPHDAWLAGVAAELNLSETAFVVPRPDGDHDLRWFTPSVEVPMCGHATLATAHVLGGAGQFHTRSGVLTCRPADDDWIEMDFPAIVAEPAVCPPGLGGAIGGHQPCGVWRTVGTVTLLVELADAATVRSLEPDLAAVAGPIGGDLLVSAPGDRPGIDCVSRYFAPGLGIPEDPVTGAAHCILGPFWAARLGRTTLVGEQASRRGGVVRMRVEGERVHLGGRAVTVSRGELLVPLP